MIGRVGRWVIIAVTYVLPNTAHQRHVRRGACAFMTCDRCLATLVAFRAEQPRKASRNDG